MSELPAAPTRKPRRDDLLEVTLDRIDARGGVLGNASFGTGTFRVRVEGAVPGQRVIASVLRRRRDDVEARLVEVLEAGPDTVEARCPHATSCGGCSFQALAYAAQLDQLGALLGRILAPLGERGIPAPAPVVGCEDPWHYRNKMDFTFANRRWVESWEEPQAEASFALGLHVRGRHQKVLDVQRCDIAFAEAAPLANTVRRLAREAGLDPWDLREHTGLLRHLVLRKGVATGDVMVDLVTSEHAEERVDALAAQLLAAHPEVTTFVQNVNDRPASVAVGTVERVLHGPGTIVEELGGLSFVVSANSFFQTNTRQAELLGRLVRQRAAPAAEGGVVFDLCCGAGVLGLLLADMAREVVGFELVPSAVADARRNAARNGVENLRVVEGDVAETLAEATEPAPDLVIADPPRAGLHPKALAALRRLAPGRIVYVSCNPAAAARDLVLLCADGYRILAIEPIDLFPHTPHLECVFTLDRDDRGAGGPPLDASGSGG